MIVTNQAESVADPDPSNGAAAAVEVNSISRRFGSKLALDNVSLHIPVGSVVGLVGENGAGKTTLIKHILGLLKAQTGSVRVFGLDPALDSVGVLSRIGYLSEEPDLPGWMSIDELFRYMSSFYPCWDHAYSERLRRDFGLDTRARIKDLSKGQRARAGLTIALAYRPELLVLDEPSSGLDPIVRRVILGAVIRTIAEEGRTVLFSSHLLAEVECVSDRVAMIRSGRILFCDSLDRIKASHTRLLLAFDDPLVGPPPLRGVLTWNGGGRQWTAICAGEPQRLQRAAEDLGARVLEQAPLLLDEVFVAYSGASHELGRRED